MEYHLVPVINPLGDEQVVSMKTLHSLESFQCDAAPTQVLTFGR